MGMVGGFLVITVSFPSLSCVVVEVELGLGLGFDNMFLEYNTISIMCFNVL